jgi:hypothetical protein
MPLFASSLHQFQLESIGLRAADAPEAGFPGDRVDDEHERPIFDTRDIRLAGLGGGGYVGMKGAYYLAAENRGCGACGLHVLTVQLEAASPPGYVAKLDESQHVPVEHQ